MRITTDDKRITLQLTKLSHPQNNTGNILMHIHGFGVNGNIVLAHNWLQQASLDAGFDHVYLPDLIGHGYTTGPLANADCTLQLKYLKKHVKYITQHHPNCKLYVSGHSFGGWLAMRLTHSMDCIKACMPIAPALFLEYDGVGDTFRPLTQVQEQWWFRTLCYQLRGMPDALISTNPVQQPITFDNTDPDYPQHIAEQNDIYPKSIAITPIRNGFMFFSQPIYDLKYSKLKKKLHVLIYEDDLAIDVKLLKKFFSKKDCSYKVLPNLPHEPPKTHKNKDYQIQETTKGYKKIIDMCK